MVMMMMISSSKSNLISCNYPTFPTIPKTLNPTHHPHLTPRTPISKTTLFSPTLVGCLGHSLLPPALSSLLGGRRLLLQTSRSSTGPHNPSGGPVLEEEEEEGAAVEKSGGGGGDGGDWTTSVLLLGLWAALMYYVFQLAPDQTPSRDMYFLQKLLNLKGDDGFRMNEVLVALWYIMGLWPLVYSMLLLPSGRSSRSKVLVWPFLVLSFFGGAYALIPYFVLWRPPPPAVDEDEIGRWPINFLESKITAGVLTATGLGLIIYAGLAPGDVWKEFYQYFRESKFIHATCIDFTLLSAFSAFWVYNDMTARKWFDEGSWLLPVALIPFVGPAMYLLLRRPLSEMPVSIPPSTGKNE